MKATAAHNEGTSSKLAEVAPRVDEPDFSLPMQSLFTNHLLLLVDALGASDLNTVQRIWEDVSAQADNIGRKRYAHYRKVRTKDEFLDSLAELHDWCERGYRPILHIEGHGDAALGVQVADSGEVVGWQELDAMFRELNSAAVGNLGIVLSTCFGYRQLQAVAIDQPSPYVFMIGPKEVVSAGAAQAELTVFYTTLLSENNLNVAVGKLSPAWGYFDSQKAFAIGFVKRLEAGRSSREANRVSDHLLAKIDGQDEFIDRIPIAQRRKTLKKLLRTTRIDFELHSEKFFHGRPPPVTYEQLSKFAREYKMGL